MQRLLNAPLWLSIQMTHSLLRPISDCRSPLASSSADSVAELADDGWTPPRFGMFCENRLFMLLPSINCLMQANWRVINTCVSHCAILQISVTFFARVSLLFIEHDWLIAGAEEGNLAHLFEKLSYCKLISFQLWCCCVWTSFLHSYLFLTFPLKCTPVAERSPLQARSRPEIGTSLPSISARQVNYVGV